MGSIAPIDPSNTPDPEVLHMVNSENIVQNYAYQSKVGSVIQATGMMQIDYGLWIGIQLKA